LGVGLGQLAIVREGLLGGLQGLLAPAQIGKVAPQVVEARGEVGEEGLGVGLGQLAADGYGLLRRLQRLLAPAQVGEVAPQVVETLWPRSGRKAWGLAWA